MRSDETPLIFDFHTHIYPTDGRGFWKQPSSAEDLIRAMDEAGVQQAGVIGIAPFIPTEYVARVCQGHPERLVAIGSVDPMSEDPLGEVDRAVDEFGVRGIKIHPRLQEFGIEDLQRVVLVAERCALVDVPLVVCTFQGGLGMFRSRILELCGEIACAAPKTTVVLAHSGGHHPIEALLVQKAHANVLLELSFSPLYYRGSSVELDFAYLVNRCDKRRLLFGSDFPEMSMLESVSYCLDLLGRAHVSMNDTEAILRGNALRALGVGA